MKSSLGLSLSNLLYDAGRRGHSNLQCSHKSLASLGWRHFQPRNDFAESPDLESPGRVHQAFPLDTLECQPFSSSSWQCCRFWRIQLVWRWSLECHKSTVQLVRNAQRLWEFAAMGVRWKLTIGGTVSKPAEKGLCVLESWRVGDADIKIKLHLAVGEDEIGTFKRRGPC